MNKAFKKGKLIKWYGSRFYLSCLTPKISYSKWLSMQPKAFQDLVLGAAKAALFRNTDIYNDLPWAPYHGNCIIKPRPYPMR